MDFFLGRSIAQQGSPPAWPGVALARAVGKNLHLFHCVAEPFAKALAPALR